VENKDKWRLLSILVRAKFYYVTFLKVSRNLKW